MLICAEKYFFHVLHILAHLERNSFRAIGNSLVHMLTTVVFLFDFSQTAMACPMYLSLGMDLHSGHCGAGAPFLIGPRACVNRSLMG